MNIGWKKHVQRAPRSFRIDLEGLAGRILGQDILLRRIIIQIAVNQAALRGANGIDEQRRMLAQWLDESKRLIDQIRIDHPSEDIMKDAARSSLEINLGDVIQAIEEAMKTVN
jgi:hypothetical protein